MVLLKSFFRKKNTRIYFIIFVIISSVFLIVFYTQNYFIKMTNQNYKSSFLYFLSNKMSHNEIITFDNISSTYCSYTGEFNNYEYILSTNKLTNVEISKEEIILPNTYQFDFKENDEISLIIKEKNYTFRVKDFFETKGFPYLFLINEDFLKSILENEDKVTYVVDLKNWAYKDETIQKIKEKFNPVSFSYHIVSQQNINFDRLIIVFNIFLTIIFIIFALIFVITCFNVVSDEKINNKLYYLLGYSKTRISLIMLIKIGLIALPFLFSIIIMLFI